MASGARMRAGADIALAVTGIAGPSGGTRAKPVGLVYIAVSSKKKRVCAKHLFSGNRTEIKERTAHTALMMLYSFLKGNTARHARRKRK